MTKKIQQAVVKITNHLLLYKVKLSTTTSCIPINVSYGKSDPHRCTDAFVQVRLCIPLQARAGKGKQNSKCTLGMARQAGRQAGGRPLAPISPGQFMHKVPKVHVHPVFWEDLPGGLKVSLKGRG